MTPDHGLDERALRILRQTLAPHAAGITAVALFGSRATGRYRPASDVDLVLYGDLPEAALDRLRTDFVEGALPFRVDLLAYARIDEPALKAHIDRCARPLFTRDDLLNETRSVTA